MAIPVSFLHRLRAVATPTAGQALGAIFVSLSILILGQSASVLRSLGITDAALNATQAEFHSRVDVILRSSIASQVALITFWATVGLVAYLVCWGLYNVLIEARNELTLTTAYTNRKDYSDKHWGGAIQTLALKTAAGSCLALVIGSMWSGVAYWLLLSSQVLSQPTMHTALSAVAAVLGFAVQLYLILAFALLTFTPWYRAETFTEARS